MALGLLAFWIGAIALFWILVIGAALVGDAEYKKAFEQVFGVRR